MVKKIGFMILIILLITSCNSKETFSENNTPIEEVYEKASTNTESEECIDDGCTEGDIEEDINAIDLEKDEKLTIEAKEEHKTEEDVLVPQDEVDEKNDEIGEGSKIETEIEEESEYKVLKTFNSELPSNIILNKSYDKYPISYNYILVLNSNINIREEPTTESKVIKKAFIYEKINLEEKIKGQYLENFKNDIWYKLFWKDKNGEIQYGYVFADLVEPREFQFEKMIASINKLKEEVENNKTAYISNYKNRNGAPPLYKGKGEDNHEIKRYQSAPAYMDLDNRTDFRYIQDGVLVSILGESKGFYKIQTPNFQGEYWVPKKYVSFYKSIEELEKVIVVDRKNQNEGVFEYKDGKWNLLSYVFATTGEEAKYKQETDLGYFMAIQTRPKFLYLDDVTREISGYAPYAIRFNGGAYIHGVPVNFKTKDGKRVDPGMKEYLFTIGSVPRSHKCVRNYTSHAKFLYDWIEIGKSSVIVIE